MNKLLILTSYAKFELNSWTNHEITIKLPITNGCRDTVKVRITSYLNNGYDVINCFAKGDVRCPPPPVKRIISSIFFVWY